MGTSGTCSLVPGERSLVLDMPLPPHGCDQQRKLHNCTHLLGSHLPDGVLPPEVLLDGQGGSSLAEEFSPLEPATDVLLYHNTTLPQFIQSEFL